MRFFVTIIFVQISLMVLATFRVGPIGFAHGQKGATEDGPVGIFDSDQQYSSFMRSAKQAAYGPEGTPEMQAMIPMLNDVALGKPMGWTADRYQIEGSTFGLLSDTKVRDELEMVDDQFDQLQSLNEELQKRAAEQIRGLDFSNGSWLDQVRAIREQTKTDLDGLLLPHQRERLQQIQMRSLLRRRSLVDIITSDPVKTNLEITDDQSTELKKAEKEIEEQLEKDIARLREKARDRLLSKLNGKQKSEVETMLGEAFEFQNDDDGRRKNERRSKGKGNTKGGGKGK